VRERLRETKRFFCDFEHGVRFSSLELTHERGHVEVNLLAHESVVIELEDADQGHLDPPARWGEPNEWSMVGSGHYELRYHGFICVMDTRHGDMEVWKGHKHAAQQLMHGLSAIVGRTERRHLIAGMVECRNCAWNVVGIFGVNVLLDDRLAALSHGF
jgi:hypothetical protein